MLGIEQAEYPAERVVARQAVLKREKLTQELLLRCGKFRHINRLAAAQHRAQRNQQYFKQIMTRRVTCPRIIQIIKNRRKTVHQTSRAKPSTGRINLNGNSNPTASVQMRFPCRTERGGSFATNLLAGMKGTTYTNGRKT